MSEGCNNLLAAGARLVRTYNDVLEEIDCLAKGEQASLPVASNSSEYVLLQFNRQGLS